MITRIKQLYYYGEAQHVGQPDGTGIACYADQRLLLRRVVEWQTRRQRQSGCVYVYYDDDYHVRTARTAAAMYAGEWKNDLPGR